MSTTDDTLRTFYESVIETTDPSISGGEKMRAADALREMGTVDGAALGLAQWVAGLDDLELVDALHGMLAPLERAPAGSRRGHDGQDTGPPAYGEPASPARCHDDAEIIEQDRALAVRQADDLLDRRDDSEPGGGNGNGDGSA